MTQAGSANGCKVIVVGLVRRVSKWLLIAVVSMIFAYQTMRLTGYISGDFGIFYDAAHRFAVDPTSIYRDHSQTDFVADIATLQGYLYPPPSILVFAPLTLGSKLAAFMVFSWLAMAAAILACWMWLRLMARDGFARPVWSEVVALIGLACVTGPVFSCRGGQVDTFILLLCVLGVGCGTTRWAWLGGVALAAGGWIKIYPGLILLYSLQQNRRIPLFVGFVAAAIAIPVLSLAIVPFETYRVYFEQLFPNMSGRAIINIDNQSLHAIWLRFAYPEIDAQTSFAAFEVPALVSASIGVAALASIAAFSVRCRALGTSTLMVAAVVLAWIGPIAPLGWGHSFAYGLPLLLMVLEMAWRQTRLVSLFLAFAAWVAIVLPAHNRLSDTVPDLLAQLFYARYTIATLLLMTLAWRLCRYAALKPLPDRPI
jgi:alpha-1,2-mannosyltransferase